MTTRTLTIAATGLVLVAITFGVIRVHAPNAARRIEIETLRMERRDLAPLRAETTRRRAELAQAIEAREVKAKEARAELAKVRRQIARREETAARAMKAATSGQQSAVIDPDNRDPEKGPVSVRHYTHAGHATPSAAFQTVIAAALKGDEAALRGSLALDPGARRKAEEMLVALPADAREKYPNPESLAALAWIWMGEHFQDAAFHIVGTDLNDSQHATVHTRSAGSQRDNPVRMELGAGGWKLVVSEGMMESFQRRLKSTTPETKPQR